MGTNTNIGQQQAVTVFGNPESFKKIIRNHGQLCKIKQAIVCPCVADNHGSADYNCTVCNGDGFIYTYQRKFLVSDEISRSCKKEIYPFWNPVTSVEKVQNVTSEVQGGITELEVESFNDTTIFLKEEPVEYEKKRVTYFFDGWSYVASDKLTVDAENGIMYTTQTAFDAGYQSSNPLKAYADITKIIKIWNIDTGQELTDYNFSGNMITTTETIEVDKMYAEYYYSDMTEVITNDIVIKDNSEEWTHDIGGGECRVALYPYWDVGKGDMIVISATVLWKNELIKHIKDIDRLFEIEIYQLYDVIIDENGDQYNLGTDYILQGRFVKWISDNKPALNSTISVRYGYKPTYIIYEDNPQPNNLENRQYPKIVMAKVWSKTSKDDITRLVRD